MGGAAIAGLILAIVGAATQMYAQDRANRAAQAQLNAGMQQQKSAQDKINQQIAQATENYALKNHTDRTESEATRISADIKKDVAESQAIRDEQQATAGNVSSDYAEARSAAQADTAQEMNAFADLIGRIRSAGTARQKEGWKTNRHLQNIGFIGRNAQGDWSVAQAKANDALHSKDGLANFGKLMSAAGTVMSMGGAAAGLGAGTAGTLGAETAANGAVAGAGAAGVDAVSAAAPTVAPTLANQASLWWNGRSPLAKAGMIGGGATLASAIATNPWRK